MMFIYINGYATVYVTKMHLPCPVTLNHYYQLSLNMASQLANELCYIKHCWGVYEQNSIVNSARVDYWTAE